MSSQNKELWPTGDTPEQKNIGSVSQETQICSIISLVQEASKAKATNPGANNPEGVRKWLYRTHNAGGHTHGKLKRFNKYI